MEITSMGEWLDTKVIFLLMVFTAAFLLVQGLVAPVFGENRRLRKQLRHRLDTITEESEQVGRLRKDDPQPASARLREFENSPLLRGVREAIAQAGWQLPAHRLVLSAALFAIGGFTIGILVRAGWPAALALATVGLAAPFVRLQFARNKRLARFDEQLPEALDVMIRALRAGHPFKDTLRLVGSEMADPVAGEFRQTFHDINYGGDTRHALYAMAKRVPSVNVTAMITAILIQKETGGNLSEVLEKLSSIIRGRYRFHRKTRTLSAEARMSAWILTLVPFVLFVVISITNPDYLPMLTENPDGKKIIAISFVMMLAGIAWMRKLVRIDV
jgi:tight adherence protein B